jgi:EmrB/QacA subfamily drug resistance transporter
MQIESRRTEGRAILRWGGPLQESNRVARDDRWWALSATLLVMFTAALSTTIVATATPTIVSELDGATLYGWVFTSFTLAAAVIVPIAGRLSDSHGRRTVALVGIPFFALGSLLAGFAPSMLWLIAARAVAGLGGGAMLAIATATIADIFPPIERGRWMGVVVSAFGLANIAGPVIGAAITEHLGWRWVFFVSVPLAAAAWVMIGMVLPRVKPNADQPIDWRGSVLLSLGLLAILLGFTWGGTTYPWLSWQEALAFGGGSALLVLFAFAERAAPAAVLDPALFRNPAFSLGLLVSFLLFGAMQVAVSFAPLFVQGVIGMSVESSGIVLTPMMGAFVVGAVAGGQVVARTGKYKVQSVLGTVGVVVGSFTFSRLTPSSSQSDVVVAMIVIGLALGSCMPIFSMTIQSAFPHTLLGTVTSARQLAANLGGAILVPVMTVLLVSTFAHQLAPRVPDAARPLLAAASVEAESLLTAESQRATAHQFAALPDGGELHARYIENVRESLASAIRRIFEVCSLLGVLAALVALVYPRIALSHWDDEPQVLP